MDNANNAEYYAKLTTLLCLVDGKLDSLIDATAQIIAKQENKDYKDVVEQMAKKASEYAKDTLEKFLKEDSDSVA